MRRLLPAVAKGRAVLKGDELRCAGPRADDPTRTCNKLIAKVNKYRHLAGSFLCERCKQDIEVRMVPTRQPALKPAPGPSGQKRNGMQHPLRFGETQNDASKEVSPT